MYIESFFIRKAIKQCLFGESSTRIYKPVNFSGSPDTDDSAQISVEKLKIK